MFAPDAFYTQGFNYVKDGDEMHACSSQPTNFSQAIAASLGSVSLSGGDFSEGAGEPDGRALTIAAKAIEGTGNGTATHIAVCREADSTLRYVTTILGVEMATGVAQQFASWKITLRAPTAA